MIIAEREFNLVRAVEPERHPNGSIRTYEPQARYKQATTTERHAYGGVGGLTFASGQAAITAAVLTLCHSGQNIVSSTSLYGGTWTLFTQTFKKLGIEVRLFDPSDADAIAGLVDENTRCVYIESMGNPKNDVPDFRKVADAAHAAGLPLICDNTVLCISLIVAYRVPTYIPTPRSSGPSVSTAQ